MGADKRTLSKTKKLLPKAVTVLGVLACIAVITPFSLKSAQHGHVLDSLFHRASPGGDAASNTESRQFKEGEKMFPFPFRMSQAEQQYWEKKKGVPKSPEWYVKMINEFRKDFRSFIPKTFKLDGSRPDLKCVPPSTLCDALRSRGLEEEKNFKDLEVDLVWGIFEGARFKSGLQKTVEQFIAREDEDVIREDVKFTIPWLLGLDGAIGKKNNLADTHRYCLNNPLLNEAPSWCNFIPRTFKIPEEKEEWIKESKKLSSYSAEEKKSAWILKPVAGYYSRGIFLVGGDTESAVAGIEDKIKNACEESKSSDNDCSFSYVAQEYVRSPAIWKDRKFDMRFYGVIPSTDPLRILIQNFGFVKTGAAPYDDDISDDATANSTSNIKLSSAGSPAMCKHITTVTPECLQHANNQKLYNNDDMTYNEFIANVPLYTDEDGFFEQLKVGEKTGAAAKQMWKEEIWPNCEEAATQTIISALERIKDEKLDDVSDLDEVAKLLSRQRQIGVLGFDAIVGSNGECVIEEVNLNGAIPFEKDLPRMKDVITDVATLTGAFTEFPMEGYDQERMKESIIAFCENRSYRHFRFWSGQYSERREIMLPYQDIDMTEAECTSKNVDELSYLYIENKNIGASMHRVLPSIEVIFDKWNLPKYKKLLDKVYYESLWLKYVRDLDRLYKSPQKCPVYPKYRPNCINPDWDRARLEELQEHEFGRMERANLDMYSIE